MRAQKKERKKERRRSSTCAHTHTQVKKSSSDRRPVFLTICRLICFAIFPTTETAHQLAYSPLQPNKSLSPLKLGNDRDYDSRRRKHNPSNNNKPGDGLILFRRKNYLYIYVTLRTSKTLFFVFKQKHLVILYLLFVLIKKNHLDDVWRQLNEPTYKSDVVYLL